MSGDTAPGATPDSVAVYHIELRQFPHNLCHFNMTAEQLGAAVVEPWVREEWIEMGDRKWSPHQAKLTVLESPHIPVEELSMGRGWRAAQREGRDVTESVLAAARERIAGGAQTVHIAPGRALSGQGDRISARAVERIENIETHDREPEAPGVDLLADSLGLELLGRLGAAPAPLRGAWELAGTRHPQRTASECLALAERAVVSLLGAGLVVLMVPDGEGGGQRRLEQAEAREALPAVGSWSGESPGGVMLRKT
jgi:hypothetical protein